MTGAVHLRQVSLRGIDPREADRFPFDVPAIRALTTIEFTTPVTFLVGENATGNPTFLEAVAPAAATLPAATAAVGNR